MCANSTNYKMVVEQLKKYYEDKLKIKNVTVKKIQSLPVTKNINEFENLKKTVDCAKLIQTRLNTLIVEDDTFYAVVVREFVSKIPFNLRSKFMAQYETYDELFVQLKITNSINSFVNSRFKIGRIMNLIMQWSKKQYTFYSHTHTINLMTSLTIFYIL